ncbi:MAG: hypothetical protein MJE77_15405 [Proteobacteria bacterium]|nr:hypothetical protein [Pseudomonadota bacterium]
MDKLQTKASVVDAEQKLTYAGIYLLKKMDLKPQDGGMEMPVLVPSELAPLEEVLQKLHFDDMIEINRRKERYDITKKGYAYLDDIIDEATALIEQYGDEDLEDVVEELEERNLDVFRARFIWGWYEGEFDDLVRFQQQRGISPIEEHWAYFLLSDDFYNNLALELDV